MFSGLLYHSNMHALISFLNKTVDYLLNFILDEEEILSEMRSLGENQFIDYLNENFRQGRSDLDSHLFYLLDYRVPEIKSLIWQLKFNDNYKIAQIFGKMLSVEIERISGFDFLIPIPVHKKRRRERGYNQCDWLCENIIKNLDHTDITYNKNVLVRKTYTTKQSWSTSKKERLEKVENIYDVKNPEIISGQNIILIDDVYTTGATVNEARRRLLASGAESVIVLTIAH
jgi:ComF family protein